MPLRTDLIEYMKKDNNPSHIYFLKRTKLESLMRRILPLLFIIALSAISGLHAQCGDNFHILNPRDFKAVQTFINSKRTIPMIEKEKYVKIHGDIRANFLYRDEMQGSRHLRGRGVRDSRGLPVPFEGFEAEFNLWVDHKTETTWSIFHVQEANTWGVGDALYDCRRAPQALHGSGVCNDLCVKRCYFGWRVYECPDDSKLDIEIGRRPLYTIADSRIEFSSRFDGVMGRYTKKVGKSSDAYLMLGAFVINFRDDHYGFIGETGVYDLFEKKIDAKYSLIDWTLNHKSQCGISNPLGSRFVISQWSLGLDFPKERFGRKARIYGAFLINHDAPKTVITDYERANIGWYAGFIIGEVRKEGDWSYDMNYQYVEAQAVPDPDVRGIGRGNVLRETLTADRRGKANYHGMHFEFLYALNDNLSIDALYDFSNAINKHIGGPHYYSKAEVDFIYAF